MARYGTFKYGSGVLYGASPITVDLLWSFVVMWNGIDYTGENEATRMIDCRVIRGRENLLRADSNGFEKFLPGQAIILLDNDDGRYDPWNTGSPLYPNILPGKFCRLGVRTSVSTYELMRGIITDIQPYRLNNRRAVRIEIQDGIAWLQDRIFTLGRTTNVATLWYALGETNTTLWLFTQILQKVGWPVDEWPLADYPVDPEHNDDTIRLFYAWFTKRRALDAIRELEDVEVGHFFHDRNGEARFIGHSFTQENDLTITEDELLRDIAIQQPWEMVRNRIRIAVHPMKVIPQVDPAVVLWELNDKAFIPAGGQLILYPEFLYENRPAAPSVDWWEVVVTTNADGTGTNISSSIVINYIQLGEIQGALGDKAQVTLSNSNASGGYIQTLRLYARPVYSPYDTGVESDDTTSRGVYGDRVLTISSPWMQETAYAQEIADWLLEELKDAHPFPVVQIEARPDLQLPLDLYLDRIRLQLPTLGIDAYFRIGKLEHKWLRENGQHVLTTLHLEDKLNPFGGPVDILPIISSPFDDPGEVDCDAEYPAGRLDWCLDPSEDEGWGWIAVWEEGVQVGGYLSCPLSNTYSGTGQASGFHHGTQHVITQNNYVTFDYAYRDTDAEPANSQAVRLELRTVESGLIVSDYVPFVQVAGQSGWFQHIVAIPEAYLGETINSMKFIKNTAYNPPPGSGTVGPIIYIDNLVIGVI